jgi:Ca2+-binding RTX toxin-like protein
MLAIIGVLGALVAGIAADAVMSFSHSDDETDDPTSGAHTAPGDTADLLKDDPPADVVPPGAEVETDPAPAPDDRTRLVGTAADDFMTGGDDADWINGAAGDDTIDGGAGADMIFGGAGDDALLLGAGDHATGDAGADAYTLNDYRAGDLPAVIADYAPDEDRIVLIYDADLHPEPIVQTEAIEGTQDVSVLLDGIRIAIVEGAAGLHHHDIALLAA